MQERPPFIMLAWHTRELLPLFTWKTIKPRNIKPKNDNLLTSTGYCWILFSIFWADRKQFSKDVSLPHAHPLEKKKKSLWNTLTDLCISAQNLLTVWGQFHSQMSIASRFEFWTHFKKCNNIVHIVSYLKINFFFNGLCFLKHNIKCQRQKDKADVVTRLFLPVFQGERWRAKRVIRFAGN